MKLLDNKTIADFIAWAIKNFPNVSKWLSENLLIAAILAVGVLVAAALIAAALRAIVAAIASKRVGGFSMRGLSIGLKRHACGVVLGSLFRIFSVCSPEDKEGHIGAIGSSGSGKTQDIYIPTLRYWGGHWLAFDAAGDIEQSLRRSDLLVFSPDDPENMTAYNVFFAADRVSDWEDKKAELSAISAALIPDSALAGENAAYFAGNARQVLTAVLWGGYKAGKDFGEIMRDLAAENSIDSVLESIQRMECADAWKLVSALQGQNDKNLAGVWGELRGAALSLFTTSARVCGKLNRSGISPATLESNSVLVSFPAGRLPYFSSLCCLIYAQTANYCYSRPVGAKPRILLAIDELPKFGRVDVLSPLEQVRKFGVRLMLAFQSISDLRRVYGADETDAILENLQIKAVTECIGVDSQEYFSKLAGQIQVIDKRRTMRVGADKPTTESTGERWDPLLRPDELARLRHRDNKLIVFHHGEVAKLRKWPAYKDKGYKRRAEKQIACDKAEEHSKWLAASLRKEREIEKKLRRGDLIEVYVKGRGFQNMTQTEAEIYYAKREAERIAADARENERCWKEYRKMNH